MTERFEIRLAPARLQELQQVAAEVGISAADVCRLAIHEFLRRDGRLQLPETAKGQRGAAV
jgi:hypothetical protein